VIVFTADQMSKCAAAARLAALEEAAKACDEVEAAADDQWDLTADPTSQGESLGAVKCAAAIRALKEKP
jgi:hypothetical protein